MKIKILDEAENDIANGINFYEKQNFGLGNYFLDSIFSDIESLRLYAGIHFKVDSYYRLLSKRFPFAIYYKIQKETVYVYAVLDCRRNPTWLDKQLSNRKREKEQ